MLAAGSVLLLGAVLLNAPPPATVVVSATFFSGRGACQLLPDGSHRWARVPGFTIRKVHRGTVRTESIGVQPDVVWSAGTDGALVEGREYVLFLRPSEESLKTLRRSGAHRLRDALAADEVLAIVDREMLEQGGRGL